MVAGQIEWYTTCESFTVREYSGGKTHVKFMCLESLIEYLKSLEVKGSAMDEISDPSKWVDNGGMESVGVPVEVPSSDTGRGIENPAMFHV